MAKVIVDGTELDVKDTVVVIRDGKIFIGTSEEVELSEFATKRVKLRVGKDRVEINTVS